MNLRIETEKLRNLNDLLTILRDDESVSPYFLARKTKIPVETIIKLLNCLVTRSILNVSFVLRCNNEDNDLIHRFDFENEDELLDFLRENDGCSHCESDLLTKDIRVFYKMNSRLIGDLYG